ncbi:CPBP family intramembrane glutamic endopeptidase [Gleimia hominis]|uniref:CPBP family intramembrane glutamic endopeptidase n=1 Tax=Gleimia hominis TaxID=595468 RepID=UPI000C810022|nr:CPBP family intramembrane glutamic endopeptidase [Gleimia hominis]WIK64423.1 CPBP family intramembrane metalloprotease [Gleimia hominis]
MSASALALVVTIGILPAFGVTMLVIDLLAKRIPALDVWVVDRAALIYLMFTVAGVVVAWGVGLIPMSALWKKMNWGLPLALLLVPAAAIVPYFIELALSAASRGNAPSLGAGIFLRDAEPAVGALLDRPLVWWSVAVGTALTEEFLFRGAVLHAVLSDTRPLLAILASAVVFGLHHVAFGINAIIGKILAGLLWGGLVLLAGTVFASITAHLLFQCLVWRRYRKVRAQRAW